MKLYHYTSLWHLEKILADGEIKLSPSNLKEPVDLHFVNGAVVSSFDSYHPVVWLSNKLDFDTAKDNGLSGSIVDKTECALVIRNCTTPRYRYWLTWAKEHKMEKEWFKAMIESAPNYKTWFITEKPIPVDDNVSVVFRPDIYERLQRGEYRIKIKDDSIET